MAKRVVESVAALRAELAERMKGAPDGYRDGERLVPIRYEMTVEPLEDADEYAGREYVATQTLGRTIRSPRMEMHARTCLSMYSNAQRSDDGVGVSFMTRTEKLVASDEWSARLRKLVEESERRDKANGPSILVDVEDD